MVTILCVTVNISSIMHYVIEITCNKKRHTRTSEEGLRGLFATCVKFSVCDTVCMEEERQHGPFILRALFHRMPNVLQIFIQDISDMSALESNTIDLCFHFHSHVFPQRLLKPSRNKVKTFWLCVFFSFQLNLDCCQWQIMSQSFVSWRWKSWYK